ncbi:hypothetical protein EVAR_44882_1 [Eumeta japonica]|uniref:Uncharacterized protein n=1 Tax=Eumeta variegata TaxID=151549 RepID=A0A4C1Y7C0_EUMVA|nr:hypothetical protein EVAR_44882_1 [Eumeta japonica]
MRAVRTAKWADGGESGLMKVGRRYLRGSGPPELSLAGRKEQRKLLLHICILLCESFPLSGGFRSHLSTEKHDAAARTSVKKTTVSYPVSEPKEQLHIVLYPTRLEDNHIILEDEVEAYKLPSLSYSQYNVEYINARYNHSTSIFCEILPLDQNAISEFLKQPSDDIEDFVLRYYVIKKSTGENQTCLYVFESHKQPNSSDFVRSDIKSSELIQNNPFIIKRQELQRISNRRKKENGASMKTNDTVSSITLEYKTPLRPTTQASLSIFSTEITKDVNNKDTSYRIQSSSESQEGDNSLDIMELEGMKESRSPSNPWYGIIGGVPALSSGYLVSNRGIVGN